MTCDEPEVVGCSVMATCADTCSSQCYSSGIAGMISLENQKRALLSYITMKEEGGGARGYFKCDECLRIYVSEDMLEKHIVKKHSERSSVSLIPREAANFHRVIQSKITARSQRAESRMSHRQVPAPAPTNAPLPTVRLGGG